MSKKTSRDSKKEEFLLSISYDEAVRLKENKEADFVTGVRLDTGETINVRMLDSDELYDYGLNKLKRDGNTTRQRPSLNDLMDRPAMTKFINLTNMMNKQGIDPVSQGIPANITLKINTAVKTADDFYGTRWVNVMNGAGAMGMSKDNFFAASGLENNGRLFSIARPISKRGSDKAPTIFASVAFTEQAEIDNSLSFLEDANGISKAMKTAANLCKNVGGGNPLVKLVVLDESNVPVEVNVKRTVYINKKPNDVIESESNFTISSTYKNEDGKYVGMTPEESVERFLSTDEGVSLNEAVSEGGFKVVSVPVCQMMYGKDASLKISTEISDRHRDFFYSHFEKEVDGMLGQQEGFNEGFVCIREGDWKSLVFITESFTLSPNNPSVRISDIASKLAKDEKTMEMTINPTISAPSM